MIGVMLAVALAGVFTLNFSKSFRARNIFSNSLASCALELNSAIIKSNFCGSATAQTKFPNFQLKILKKNKAVFGLNEKNYVFCIFSYGDLKSGCFINENEEAVTKLGRVVGN